MLLGFQKSICERSDYSVTSLIASETVFSWQSVALVLMKKWLCSLCGFCCILLGATDHVWVLGSAGSTNGLNPSSKTGTVRMHAGMLCTMTKPDLFWVFSSVYWFISAFTLWCFVSLVLYQPKWLSGKNVSKITRLRPIPSMAVVISYQRLCISVICRDAICHNGSQFGA